MFGAHFGLDLCDSDTTYCSKIANDVLIYSEMFKEREVLSPSGLYFKLLRVYGNNCSIIDREYEHNAKMTNQNDKFQISIKTNLLLQQNENKSQSQTSPSNPIDWSGSGVLSLKQMHIPSKTGYAGK